MRRQLIGLFAAVASLVALAFVVPLGLLVQRTAEDRAIDAARSDAAAVTPVVAIGSDQGQVERALALTAAGTRGEMTVVTPAFTVGPPAPGSDRLAAALSTGASRIGPVEGGEEVVVAIATGPDELSAIRVFVPDSRLVAGRTRAWLALALVATALTLIAVVVADRLARRVVEPARSLAAAAGRLGRGDLETRVEPAGPDELAQLGQVFNQLGSRIEAMLADERELVAELSHRLRTPLTTLRLRLDQVADATLANQLGSDLDGVVSVLDDLIAQARRTAARGGPLTPETSCDAVAVVAERAGYWSALAEDQGRPWELRTGQEPGWVAVAGSDLAAAVDAALENVFAHTPDGSAVSIAVSGGEQSLDVTVADAGPGFAPSAVERGVAGGGSTGLGLDIIRRTCEAAGGSLALGPSHLGGGAVILRLPLLGHPPGAPGGPEHHRVRGHGGGEVSDAQSSSG
jgi:signal transduction histidine kinase